MFNTYDNTVLSNIDIRANDCSIYNRTLTNVNMVTNVKWEKCYSEILKTTITKKKR